jgi:hypothetical protein
MIIYIVIYLTAVSDQSIPSLTVRILRLMRFGQLGLPVIPLKQEYTEMAYQNAA